MVKCPKCGVEVSDDGGGGWRFILPASADPCPELEGTDHWKSMDFTYCPVLADLMPTEVVWPGRGQPRKT